MQENNVYISVIIPLLNECESLTELHQQLENALKKITQHYEIIFIDDGSRDNSYAILNDISQKYPTVKVISFYRNNGKSAAYSVGFKASKGNVIFTLDADLQDVPSEMEKLLQPILSGADLAVGWKQNRINNEPLKKIPSYFYNRFKFLLFGLKLHDSNSGFRCMKREVALSLNLYGDRYRFIPEFTHLAGYKVVEVATLHQSRKFGKSKYNGSRFLTGLLDLISVRYLSFYAHKPLQFFGLISFVFILIGILVEAYVILAKLNGSSFQMHIAALILGALFGTMGLIFLSIGLLGEMLTAKNHDANYAIKEKNGFEI